MVNKIILNIHHSDDYTDYLFLTAGLTNKRIIPFIDPSKEKIIENSDINTLVIGCYASLKEPGITDNLVSYDQMSKRFHVLSRFYLQDDGSINPAQAEMARSIIQEKLNDILFSSSNLHEAYRRNFPLFWRKREAIYSNPLLFYAKTGTFNTSSWTYFPLGVMLKTIEGNEDLFRTRQKGGCHCEKAPLLIDYNTNEGDPYSTSWTLYTWCPSCSSRREINVEHIGAYEARLETTWREFDKKQGFSALTLFDVIEKLS